MTRFPTARWTVLLVAALSLAACGAEEAAEPASAPPAVLSADALRDRLPPSVGALDREDVAVDVQEALGAEVASATGRYSAAGETPLDLTITDLGTADMVEMMGYGWGLAGAPSPDRVDEYPAEVETGRVRVLVAERFLVEAEGPEEYAEAAVRAVDLGALAEAAGR